MKPPRTHHVVIAQEAEGSRRAKILGPLFDRALADEGLVADDSTVMALLELAARDGRRLSFSREHFVHLAGRAFDGVLPGELGG